MTGDVSTQRLLLKPWSDSYFEEFARVLQDPEAMRFISGGTPLPLETIRSIAQRSLAMWDEHGYGPWAAIEKETGRWVGRIGLNLLADWPGPDKWEVGYELAPEFWGRGLATEGARAAIRFGWASTPLPRIISATAAGHLASRRVMEKCGLVILHRGHAATGASDLAPLTRRGSLPTLGRCYSVMTEVARCAVHKMVSALPVAEHLVCSHSWCTGEMWRAGW